MRAITPTTYRPFTVTEFNEFVTDSTDQYGLPYDRCELVTGAIELDYAYGTLVLRLTTDTYDNGLRLVEVTTHGIAYLCELVGTLTNEWICARMSANDWV